MLGKAATFVTAVSLLITTMCSCGNNGRNARTTGSILTKQDVEGLREQLEEFGQRISSAKTQADQQTQLEALHAWLRQERQKWITRETGPQLGTAIMFYDRETGKRLGSEMLLSQPGEVEVEVTLDCNRAGRYEKIGAIRFRPKDPSAVESFLRE